jgi:hypothetical protein
MVSCFALAGSELGRRSVGHNILQSFFQYSKDFKLSNEIQMPSRSPNLFKAKFEHDEQLYPLAQHQIPNGFHVINFGTNFNLDVP